MDIIEQNVIGGAVSEKHAKDLGKFLNRILGLEVQKQNLVNFNFHILVSLNFINFF